MTGWRLGWIVVPEEYIEQATRLAQNLYICASSISQYGALGAFTPDAEILLENRRREFNQRRVYFCNALSEIGLPPAASVDGAFYVYVDISRYSNDSQNFCQLMLENHGVAMTPGSDFGEHKSNQYVRMSFTTSKKNLGLGIERLQLALDSFG
jgi:aspartate/methionine/tyrosine aminotransferase